MKTVEIDSSNRLDDIIEKLKKQNLKKGEESTVQLTSSEHFSPMVRSLLGF